LIQTSGHFSPTAAASWSITTYIVLYCANSAYGEAEFRPKCLRDGEEFSFDGQPGLAAQRGSTVDNYAGDYNTLAADIMNSTSGFRGGYASNKSGAPNAKDNAFILPTAATPRFCAACPENATGSRYSPPAATTNIGHA
jgi:hypothetical protein